MLQVSGQGFDRVRLAAHPGRVSMGFGLFGQFTGAVSKRGFSCVPNRFTFLLLPGEVLELRLASVKASGLLIQLQERRLIEEALLHDTRQPDLRSLCDAIPGHESLLLACSHQLLQLSEQDPGPARERLMLPLEDSILALLGNLVAGPHRQTEESAEHPQQLHVQKVMAFLEGHLGDPLTLADLCRVCNVSARTLQTSFQMVLNRTPVQAVQELRLSRLRELLLQRHDVASACELVGLAASGRMAANYKRMFGELPSQTRLRAGG